MKKCPFCAETDLQDDARVCKHCGKDLSPASKPFYKRSIPPIGILGFVLMLLPGLFSLPTEANRALLILGAGLLAIGFVRMVKSR